MLTPEAVWDFPVQMWDRVLSKVNRAVVFMDDPCAEVLHWSAGGAAALFEAGARNVKRFSSFESCSEDEPKAVFVVSTLLKGRTVDTLKDIISLSHLQYCVVVTAVSHSLHLLANNVAAEADGAAPVFEQLEDKLCEWMGDMNYTAEVLHVPLSFALVSQQLLLAPAFARLFPLLPPDLRALNATRPDKKRFASLLDVDVHALPSELQLQIKALAGALNALFEATGTREESFAVGPMSRLIAGELAGHPQAKTRRKTAPNKASIIFVDRTMDLTGAVGHHGDSLAEKILTVLKPLPGHVTDVQVDMRELTSVLISPGSESCVAPGCLAQTRCVLDLRFAYEDHMGSEQTGGDTFQTHPQKLACSAFPVGGHAHRQAQGRRDGGPTAACGSGQQGEAAHQDEHGPRDPGAAALLRAAVPRRGGGAGESLRGTPAGPGHGADPPTPPVTPLGRLPGLREAAAAGCPQAEDLSTERVHSAMERMFETLRGLRHSRDHLKQLRRVYTASDGVHQATYRPFLRQILQEVFHPDRHECVDIEHMSGGLTDLLKTGFSMFMKVSRPHPGDNPLVFLFLVGGVTPSELRLVKETLANLKPESRVLVLSTGLLRPADVPELLFAAQRLTPDIGV
ncbi:sec1 family domain-containing protein 2 isoform X3 [Phyllopteryx taeniolatus]|uniref:sec1 family domain-containing protein 2 isoform X3 n=1 Tax=Phyllopteryx taeniolatus TaxID=161469 RepID=UPI002AD39392|nr:sec1 family domain-containing protein 2 isoform X3 [Phyllopteryx taeniolatus]